ncbi:MAG: 2-oxoglutarate dehydrogenase E1 component [Halobacteriovoraceae bacterium]|nr:2-oxoglutarate dehydrogenase E1 component [Halobacteriovoraceae bacterium]
MKKSDNSHLTGSDNAYVDALYENFSNNPDSVDETWKKFFQGFEYALNSGSEHFPIEMKNPNIENAENAQVFPGESNHVFSGATTDTDKEIHVFRLIQSYRARGHLLSDTNPIRPRRNRDPYLFIENFGLEESDLHKQFSVSKFIGEGNLTLMQVIEHLKRSYCSSIGIEYMHINNTQERRWIKEHFEGTIQGFDHSLEKKKRILEKLNEAVVFENFLQLKYLGQKRFSLEGGESAIPALDAIINKGSDLGVNEFVIGMAHRGRLNVLANIMGKTYEYIFNEFEGTARPDLSLGDGDVKYHLGFRSKTKSSSGNDVYLKLMPNPSHLEVVSPVAIGFTRGQIDKVYGHDSSKICPIIVHGDAAIAGQGIVYETAQMSNLEGYSVGGTIHFVINNQIGFTTDFTDARTSIYSTSVAKAIDVPIIHINGDDVEAVIYAVELAMEYRQKFKKDVYIDMVCYRKHGHNEGDEPKFTQPTFYDLIAKHQDPREIYVSKLVGGNKIEANLAKEMQTHFRTKLQERLDLVKQKDLEYLYQKPDEEWSKLRKSNKSDFDESPETQVSEEKLAKIVERISTTPDEISPIKKAQKIIEERRKRFDNGQIDWALAEMMAYGSLLQDGRTIRISGQDVIRGTFSHRHAMVFDSKTNRPYCALASLAENENKFYIYNSLLSEYAVLGFEYGYSLVSPNNINLWEAQFGDFSNCAQPVFDQFISSSDSKWQMSSDLVVLLPHGYEGQGPEHSSARPERYLQLAAEENMYVCNLTKPSNLFHALRRQVAIPFRKPLIVFTPKSLLRHKDCISNVEEFTNGKFQEIIDDSFAKKTKVKRVLMCTGKVYFDLLEKQLADKRDDIAIVRLEQLYPLADKQLKAILKKYSKAEFIWVQEEPENMGYWTYLLRYKEFRGFEIISRKISASPASGFASVHKKEQEDIVTRSFQTK